MSDILLNTNCIICVTCRHMSQFKHKNILAVPSFLRMLVTKNGENTCNFKVPLLEQPNIVYGVTAGGWYSNNTIKHFLRYTFNNKIVSFQFYHMLNLWTYLLFCTFCMQTILYWIHCLQNLF